MTATFSPQPQPPRTVAGAGREADVLGPDPDSLACLARRLAEVAHAIRMERERGGEPDGLGRAFAHVDDALGDLAIAAELTADAVIEADRPSGTRATEVPPTPGARAVSWRLHGLADALRASHEVCRAVHAAVSHRDRSERQRSRTITA
jgi:hypothetical protein